MRSADLRWLAVLALLAACATQQSDPGPTITGSTTVDGKAFPSGESTGAGVGWMPKAPSAEYGYSQRMPVKVGGGPSNEVRYLNSLRGPQGQVLRYHRIGSCCPFETKNSEFGGGMLDLYEVTYDGAPKPLQLYLNMYDSGELFVPQGLTAASTHER